MIGVVGSPAGGKSTVAKLLQDHGATWINADLLARSVLEESEVQRQLIDHFGADVTDSGGRISRQKLAGRVFGDDDHKRAALTYLESVIHPRTRDLITQRLQEASDQGAVAAILDVPLLFESQWDRCCDEIWCIDSSAANRLARVGERGWDQDELRRREESQLSIASKRQLSSRLIRNDGTLEQLGETIGDLWSSLVKRQSEHSSDRSCHQDC